MPAPDAVPLRIHSPFRFAHRVRVRFAEGGSSGFARRGGVAPLTDAQQIVYNGAYLTYFEVARIELFRELGCLGQVEQTLAESCVQYRAPARWDDQLDCACRCARLGRTSFRLEYMIREATQDRLIATGHTVQVIVDRAGRPTVIPEAVRALLGDGTRD